MLTQIIQYSKISILFTLFFLLFSISLSAQDFLAKEFSTEPIRPLDMEVIDLDNDGDEDIVSLNYSNNISGGKISWFENINNGEFFEYHVLYSGTTFHQFEISDLDNDGDLDIIIVSDYSLGIGWYRNDGNQNFDYVLISGAFSDFEHIIVKDFNQDGYQDVIAFSSSSSSNKKLFWLKNDGVQNFTSFVIDSIRSFNKIIVDDLDLDGHLDILGVDDGRVDWYKNDGFENLTYQSLRTFPATLNSNDILLFDYNNDSYLDILNNREDGLFCLINDGLNNFSDTLVSDISLENIMTLDFDLDGDTDILGRQSYHNYPFLLEQTAPQSFSLDSLQDISTPANHITIGDLNNDDNIDIIISYQSINEITAFISDSNLDYDGINLCGNHFSTDFPYAIDLDLDGDLDVITQDFNWHENDDNGNFIHHKLLFFNEEQAYNPVNRIITNDLDGDGDYDFISLRLHLYEDKLYWHEKNSDNSYTNHLISTPQEFKSIAVIDFDQDGDKDLLGKTGTSPSDIRWLINDGNQNFTDTVIYSYISNGKYSFQDLDLDGDIDIIIGDTQNLRWLENDGNQNFTIHIIQNTIGTWISLIECFDKDDDGDIDIFVDYANNDLGSFENNGNQIFTSTISNIPPYHSFFDFDQNGVKDLFLSYPYPNKRVEILLDSASNYSTTPITTIQNTNYPIIGDFDNDGDIDLIGANLPIHYTSLFENLDINDYLHLEFIPFIDNNINGLLDTSEIISTNTTLSIQPSNVIQGSGSSNNHLYLDISQEFDISLNLDTSIWIATDSFNRHIAIDTIMPIDSTIYIGYKNRMNVLTTAEITGQWPRCNDTILYQLKVNNYGNTLDSGYVQYDIDSLAEFVSSTPSPDSINGNSFFFGFQNFQTSEEKIVNINIKLPLSIDTLEFALYTQADTGLNQIEQIDSKDFNEIVKCSYDPNDKQVFPNFGDAGYILPNTELEYLIRFQNTGNDTAFTVNILDTLDESLDISTFELIAYSHPVNYTVTSNSKTLSFFFEDINLTDTLTNEPTSHGFVKYKIKAKDTVSIDTEILNKAYIYFDENFPITTNSTSNIVYDCSKLGQNISINQNEFYLQESIPLEVNLNQAFINKAEWILNGTIISSNISSISHHLNSPGSYNLQIKLNNELCSMDTTFQILVIDNIGFNELNSILKVYPNPVTSQLFIEFDQFYQNIHVNIFDQLGQKVNQYIFSESKISFPFTKTSGMYFLEIKCDNQDPVMIKVMKK